MHFFFPAAALMSTVAFAYANAEAEAMPDAEPYGWDNMQKGSWPTAKPKSAYPSGWKGGFNFGKGIWARDAEAEPEANPETDPKAYKYGGHRPTQKPGFKKGGFPSGGYGQKSFWARDAMADPEAHAEAHAEAEADADAEAYNWPQRGGWPTGKHNKAHFSKAAHHFAVREAEINPQAAAMAQVAAGNARVETVVGVGFDVPDHDFRADVEASGLNYTAYLESQNRGLVTRDVNRNVYACSNWKWSGNCFNMVYPENQCYSYRGQRWWKSISSIGPDAHTYCWIYDDAWCKGNNFAIKKPGIGWLGPFGWNDRVGSIRCITLG
ncbi:hypothetical protein LTS18_000056 [Coniosporium uncinatum]|uniref:Uncharacterized protein n=1 Tax=Coniosporium uncinatum TaxID=93489 RepID=A0ACC3DDY2_9PEZI|nr:hypothetical protein LTS18_000056 [Coniosporium uncinatum]